MPAPLYNPDLFLRPSTVALKDALGTWFFEVPPYQRDYSWKQENVRQLWTDLLEVVGRCWREDGIPVDKCRPHFFGPIVIQRSEGSPNTVEVMDGQQRLVTFSALLAVFSEYAADISNEQERRVWTRSLEQLLFVFQDGASRPRVKLGRSQEHFNALFCQHSTRTARHKYMEEIGGTVQKDVNAMFMAYRFLENEVTRYLAEAPTKVERDARLIRLIRTTSDLCLFLQMEVSEHGVAYEVFEGLNGRGLELSQADLVKNKLFARAQEQGTLPEVKREWEATFRAISGQGMLDLPTFLQFHHLVFYGEIKATNLYDKVSSETLRSTSARDYAISVRQAAERLQQTVDAGAGFSEQAGHDIEQIRDSLRNRYALVLVIASAGQLEIASEEYARLLRIAHHFAYRHFVVGGTSLAQYATDVAEAGRLLVRSRDVAEVARLLKEKSPDEVFRARFAEHSVGAAREGFYACEMFERHLGRGAGVLPGRQSPSQHLEHIYPQRPAEGEWPTIEPERLELYLNRVGNLLILERDINSSIRNRSFEYKRRNRSERDYAHSALKMPRELSRYVDDEEDGWTLESIVSRQRSLADDLAATVWSLD